MKQRQSNLELMRLAAMLCIVAHHFAVHSGFFFQGARITGNMVFLQLLTILGKVGVNLFVMLSAWFLLDAPKLRTSKVVRLWLQLLFYSVGIYLIACGLGLTELTAWGLGAALLPVLSEQWWFASTYVFLYLLTPWLNRCLKALTRRRYGLLLLGVGVFWFVIPVLNWLPERLRYLAWFVYLYSLTGFLRFHGTDKHRSSGVCLGTGFGMLAASLGWTVFLLSLQGQTGTPYETVYLYDSHLLVLAVSVCLFLGFVRLKLGEKNWINRLAALSFGVYLLHDSDPLRYPLWRELLQGTAYVDSPWLIPYCLACTAGVYCVCALIEALRLRLLDGAIQRIAERAEKHTL